MKKQAVQKKKVLLSMDNEIYSYYQKLAEIKGRTPNAVMVEMLENTMLTAKALTEGGVIDQLKAVYKSL